MHLDDHHHGCRFHLRCDQSGNGTGCRRSPLGSTRDVDDAVARARDAADWWASLGFDERAHRLDAWRGIIARRATELADLVHMEMGKPRADAMLEIAMALEHLAWAANNAGKVLRRRTVRSSALTLNQSASVEYLPLGVVGVIGPWNYPIFTPLGSLSFALAAGNTVVYKPSEYTPGVGCGWSRPLPKRCRNIPCCRSSPATVPRELRCADPA